MRLAGMMGVAVAGVVFAGVAGSARADDGTIVVGIDAPESPGVKYRLTGQSSFHQIRTNGGTGGGQLDGFETPGNVSNFVELFPPPSLSDYLTFGYFGVIETLDETDTVISQNLVVAFDAGVAEGQTFESLFPGPFEDWDDNPVAFTLQELVAALLAGNDSPEFQGFGEAVFAGNETNGVINIPEIGQVGETMELIAFMGGNDGNEGVSVGSLSFTVTSVPEPASLALLALGAAALMGRIRR